MSIEPDTKDWTWVLERACPECGFEATRLDVATLPGRLRENAQVFARALAEPDVDERPTPDRWSILEYACHVRDVHRVFDGRVRAMLEESDPRFADWDQDAAAVEGRYAEQRADVVAEELVAAADQVAERYAGVAGEQWERPGRRSNGSLFTVDSLARYHLHDVVHHAHDIQIDIGG